jgi:hypothetical protein
MFVYIWKHNDTPFYVGLTKAVSRTNPLNAGGRNWLCKQKLAEIGPKNVVIELHRVDSIEEGQELERSLIEKYGRIQLDNGPLTNLKIGGDGTETMSDAGRLATSKRMTENNPMARPEVRAKLNARMNDPDVKAKFAGDNNPAKRPEVQAKIRAKWAEPEFKAAMIAKRKGKPIHSEESKEARRQALLNPNHPMRDSHIKLNTDPDIKAKRVAALRSPEVQAKISASLKLAWAKRKGLI